MATGAVKNEGAENQGGGGGGQHAAPSLVVGISIPQYQVNAERLLKMSRDDEYDFVTTLLPQQSHDVAREDVRNLDSKWWRTSIVGRCCSSNSIMNETTSSALFKKEAMDSVLQRLPFQINWAMHMNIPAVLLPPMPPQSLPTAAAAATADPTNPTVPTPANQNYQHDQFMEYARILSSISLEINNTGTPMQLWIPVSLNNAYYQIQQFDMLHRLCDTPSNIGIILWMETPSSSSTPPTPVVGAPGASALAAVNATNTALTVANQLCSLHQAIGNNLKAVCFPTKVFLTNKRGYPTLAKTHQVLFTEVLRRLGRTIRVLVEGPAVHMVNANTNTTNPSISGSTGCLPYLQYIQHIRKRPECVQALDTTTALLETPYLDNLQRPLQPLKDHLEFGTYETFEKDPIKYHQYRQAIYFALTDLIKKQTLQIQQQQLQGGGGVGTIDQQHADAEDDDENNGGDDSDNKNDNDDDNDDDDTSDNNNDDDDKKKNQKSKKRKKRKIHNNNNPNEITVLVAGAGRGPLATCALEAWELLCTDSMDTLQNTKTFRVYAIEKNPSAMIYLQSMKKYHPLWTKFDANTHVLQADLRQLTRSMIHGNCADIVVSELLGSFGDNELSPECLYGLFDSSSSVSSGVCKPSTISIPMRYTAHLAPCTSQRLYSEVKSQAFLPLENDRTVGRNAAFETPYVVRTHAVSQTHLEQDCWTFIHPPFVAGSDGGNVNAASTTNNNNAHLTNVERYCHLEFEPHTTCGTGLGSGYGSVDPSVINMASAATLHAQKQQQQSLQPGMPPLPQQSGAIGSGPLTIHGFIGTFTADLYIQAPSPPSMVMSQPHLAPPQQPPPQAIQISTAPSHFSKDMCSWFPLFFPLSQPLLVPKDAYIGMSIWRKTDAAAGAATKNYTIHDTTNGKTGSRMDNNNSGNKVWYEWAAQVYRKNNNVPAVNNPLLHPIHQLHHPPIPQQKQQQPGGELLGITPIHNINGRSYYVSM